MSVSRKPLPVGPTPSKSNTLHRKASSWLDIESGEAPSVPPASDRHSNGQKRLPAPAKPIRKPQPDTKEAISEPQSAENHLRTLPTKPPTPPPKQKPTPSSPRPSTLASATDSSSSRTSSTSSISTAPSSILDDFLNSGHITPPSKFLPSGPTASTATLYNPLDHYIPCLSSNCTTHYLLSSLGPTFFSAQAPYNLHRKRGSCREHACQDLQQANAECKKTYERMRQYSGRKTLRDVARDFDEFVRQIDEEREQKSQQLAEIVERKVCNRRGDGVTEKQQKSNFAGKELLKKNAPDPAPARDRSEETEWDWQYAPRPCTANTCTAKAKYSPFDCALYSFYHLPQRSGLVPLSTLCPDCAKRDLRSAEHMVGHKREELDDEEWVLWIVKLKRERIVEQELWEQALERVIDEDLGTKGNVNSNAKDEGSEWNNEGSVVKKARTGNVCIVM